MPPRGRSRRQGQRIFPNVKRPLIVVMLLLLGCHPRPVAKKPHSRDTTTLAPLFRPRHDAADSALRAPPVIDAPSVLVFWLPAGADTLPREDAASAVDDLGYYTGLVAPTLAANHIRLVPTRADTVYVALPNHSRRAILLSGLDYPYGYLLVDPGGPERILTGIYSDDELLDEINVYFDLTEDSTATTPHVTT